MILKIDSTNNIELKLSLNQVEKKIQYLSPRNQDLLKELEKFLTTHGVTLSQLTNIKVATGPGNFTSLRVGVAIASALSFALNIPINGKKPGSTPAIKYGKPPGITVSKKL